MIYFEGKSLIDYQFFQHDPHSLCWVGVISLDLLGLRVNRCYHSVALHFTSRSF